jgi:predicted DNA-binding transcriptional regulator YafY
MGRTERIFKLANLLRDRKRLRFDEMLVRMEVSPATLKRDLKYLREQLGTPVEYDAFERTYQVAESPQRPRQEMPGIWFSEADLSSLLLAQRLLSEIDPSEGLAPRLKDMLERVQALLSYSDGSWELADRIRFSMPGKRAVDAVAFDKVTTALMQRKRLHLVYSAQAHQAETVKHISPQRLVHHRTWYLDCWCHEAQELRRIALDSAAELTVLDEAAVEIPLAEVERLMDGGYGAFPGEPNHWAVLVFSAEAAQVAAKEQWHPMQRVHHLDDGRLQLMLPYDKPQDLVMDILRYGAQVEVVGNAALRLAVETAARAICALYA